jgi:hypothetical protein
MVHRTGFGEHARRREIVEKLGLNRPNKRQREEAAKRPPPEEVPTFRYQWNDTVTWHTAVRTFVIKEMGDEHLWQTVIWCVRGSVKLHEEENLPPHPALAPGLAAARWLAHRPTFRVMVRESIRRNFTYPTDVFTFLKAYLLDDKGALDDYQPWHDPQEAPQVQALESLKDLPPQPPEWDIGKPLRAIEIDDDENA